MKEKMTQMKDVAAAFWSKRSKVQKWSFMAGIVIIAVLIIGIVYATDKTKMVPLYNDLSLQESGQIKTELETRKIPYELKNGGKMITVPEDEVDNLLVDLAAQGIPDSGKIDYSFFGKNASWGITDNEFDMIKLDAMQTELANLIKGVDGIKDAKVMINMPKDPVFVSDADQEASASIVINTNPGQKFQGNQIDSLYRLVSKAVPNLPPENIVIMNQYFEYYDLDTQTAQGGQDAYAYQQSVKKDVERDIQRRVQQLLSAMVGPQNVIVSVTSDIDFTKENRVEKLVEPVDVENMKGLPVSIEKVQEAYKGNNPPAGGIEGTGDGDITNYQADDDGDGNGDYKLKKETINNEYNRIRKEIAESPYKVRDLGIQVAVNRVKEKKGKDVKYLSAQEQAAVETGVSDILNSIISTSIDQEYANVQSDDNTSIVFQEFSDHMETEQPASSAIPTWVYVSAAILLVIIIVLVFLLMRKRNSSTEESEDELFENKQDIDIPDIAQEPETEAAARRKQLEKMAKDKPEDFAKLLKGWIEED